MVESKTIKLGKKMIEHIDQVSRLEKELKEVKSIMEDLAIKNITLERENARLAGEIKNFYEKIKILGGNIVEG